MPPLRGFSYTLSVRRPHQRGRGGDERDELRRVHGLGHVEVAAGFLRPALVLLLTVAADCHDQRLVPLLPRVSAGPRRSRSSPAGRHRAARHRAGRSAIGRECGWAVVRGPHDMPRELEQDLDASAPIDPESSTTSTRILPASVHCFARGASESSVPFGSTGRRTTNSLPLPGPVAVGLDACRRASRPGCLTSVRPMPRPPCERSSDRVDLGEQVEDRRQHLRRDADAVVAHAERRPRSASRSTRQPDLRRPARCTWRRCSAGWTRTCASRVGSASSVHRLGRERRPSARGPAPRSSGRPSRRRWSHDRGQVHRLLAQLDLAAGDAATRPAGRPPAGSGARPAAPSSRVTVAGRVVVHLGQHQDVHGHCGSGPAGCAARGPAWPGTRPCGGRPPCRASACRRKVSACRRSSSLISLFSVTSMLTPTQ